MRNLALPPSSTFPDEVAMEKYRTAGRAKLVSAGCFCLVLVSCASTAPVALSPDHPAHSEAVEAPRASDASVLKSYRPAAVRRAESHPAPKAGAPLEAGDSVARESR